MQEHKESFGNAQPWKEFDAPYPSGESFKMLAERVSVGIQNVIQHAYKDDVIVLVSHQAVIGALSYFFSHSFSLKDPNIFMNHLHSSHSANAGGFLIQSKNKDLYTVEPLSNLSPVSNVNDAISFYHKQRSSAKEHTISRISSVSQNAVYHVQSAHQPVLIKVLQDDHMLTGQRLVDLYRYLEKQDDIHAPRILHYDPSRVFFQDDIVIQDYVVGDTLESCIEKRIDSLAALMPQLLQSIQTIHRIPVHEVYSFWNPPRYTTWDRFLLGEIRHMYSAIRSSTVLNREANMIVARHLHTLEQYLQHQAYQSVPLHGDLGPSNIIVSLTDTAGCVPRIVDFERARIGDPLWDYVYLQGFLERIEPVVAAEWNTQVVELIDTNQQQVYDAYRTLFHVWSVWDMLELQTDIAHVRGKRSLELLHAIEVPG
jgi:thiamine kinase-like enzyme